MSNRRQKGSLIVPIFIPNQGCPHRCVYCKQETITNQSNQPVSTINIKKILDGAIQSNRFDASSGPEVAFYGGTFTRLSKTRMVKLLEAVAPYLRKGFFRSIRVSTRPDALDMERLNLMRRFGVSTVELGAQSMDEEVLKLTERGHTGKDTIESVHLLKRHGFRVGIQLMPGLPGDSERRFMKTVETVVELQPDMVRLYPTIIIRGTELDRWYKEKRYQPLELEEAVSICQEACVRLEREGIPVIRIGLMSSPSLLKKGEIVAGPWHSAFGFLVRSSIHQKRIEPYLPKPESAKKIIVRAPSREIPLVRGYKNRGLRLIEDKTGAEVIHVLPDNSLPLGRISAEFIR